MILFDTNTLTHFLMGNENVVARVSRHTEMPAIPVVVLAEVLRGRVDSVLKAADGDQLRWASEQLQNSIVTLGRFRVIPACKQTAEHLNRFLALPKGKKLKMSHADLLIACIALANDALLVTRNTRPFEKVPGLRIENWVD